MHRWLMTRLVLRIFRATMPFLVLASMSLCFSCATPGGGQAAFPPAQSGAGGPDLVMQELEQAVRERDLKAYAACFWEEATRFAVTADGRSLPLNGIQAIRDHQEAWFRENGEVAGTFRFPDPEKLDPASTFLGIPEYIYNDPAAPTVESFQFVQKDGVWKIYYHFVSERFLDRPKAGPFQEWIDTDRDGFLSMEEQRALYYEVWRVAMRAGPADNALQEYFDWNGDGEIDDREMHQARQALFSDRLRRVEFVFPSFAWTYIHDGKGFIDSHSVSPMIDRLFGRYPDTTGPVESQLDRRFDLDNDMYISRVEVIVYAELIGRITALIPEWPDYSRQSEGSPEEIRRWADYDRDGILTRLEREDLGYTLYGALMRNDGPAFTLVERHFDADRNFWLEPQEGAAALAAFQEALGRVYASPSASEEKRNLLWLIDTDGNGTLDPEELEAFERELLAPDNWPFDQPARNALEQAIDTNRNGTLEGQEVQLFFSGVITAAAEELFDIRDARPIRAVAASLPAGLPAAASPAATAPAVRRIAVMGVASSADAVDLRVQDVFISFLENSFVNSRQVKVVDRKHIEELLKEHEFQQGMLVDQQSAVKIGRLAGADGIAIAVISSYESSFYLQIKLIATETGEIVGSGLVETKDRGELPRLCDRAVEALFRR